MKTVRCEKCPKTHEVAELQLIAVLRDAPGWGFIWDTGDGLRAAYYCDTCMPVIKAAFLAIREALGPLDIRFANFAHMANQLSAADAPARPSPGPGT